MKTELHPAAWWACEVCAKEHFVRVTERSRPGETPEHAWISHPSRVTCDACGTDHEVEYEEPGRDE